MSFALSKIIGLFLSPGNALVLLLLLGGFLVLSHHDKWRRRGKRLCFTVALVLFLIAILPIGSWLVLPLEDRFPPQRLDHIDGIILVGGDEDPDVSRARGLPVAPYSYADYALFSELARAYPQAKLIFTGGSNLISPDPDLSNAAVARAALVGLGVPVDRMVFEERSRNTYENAAASAAIIHPTPHQKWLIVTSAVHMPRTVACFRQAGWNVFPMPSSYLTDDRNGSRLQFNFVRHMYEVESAMHEYEGLIAYRLMGYTSELWPQ